MKFFTKSWHLGRLSNKESRAIPLKYQKYFEKILSKFSKEIKSDLTKTNIHDGLIDRCIFDSAKKNFHLALICGDLQRGYFKIELCYQGVDGIKDLFRKVNLLVKDIRTEILFDEFDLEENKYIHRILFWPNYSEIRVRFKKLNLKTISKKNRSLSKVKERVVLK